MVAVYLEKPPSPNEIINDLDTDLITEYKYIKNYTGDYWSTFKYPNGLNEIREFYADETLVDDHSLFYKYLLKSCNTFSNLGKGKLYKDWNHHCKLSKIKQITNRLQNTTIYNTDYVELIHKYDSEDTLFYFDPPYENSSKLYKHGDFDFLKLRDLLLNIKGKWILSINDSANIRDLFKDFNIEIMPERTARNRVGIYTARDDLIITNY